MKRVIFLLFLIFLLTDTSEADFKVYLKNGSIISGIISYQEIGEDLVLYLDSGSMNISKKDVRKIEEIASSVKDTLAEELPDKKTEDMIESPQEKPIDEKVLRRNKLKAERDSVISEIRSLEEQEAKLTSLINKKREEKTVYNVYQLRQLEGEINPLMKELSNVQNKKASLINRLKTIEGELTITGLHQ